MLPMSHGGSNDSGGACGAVLPAPCAQAAAVEPRHSTAALLKRIAELEDAASSRSVDTGALYSTVVAIVDQSQSSTAKRQLIRRDLKTALEGISMLGLYSGSIHWTVCDRRLCLRVRLAFSIEPCNDSVKRIEHAILAGSGSLDVSITQSSASRRPRVSSGDKLRCPEKDEAVKEWITKQHVEQWRVKIEEQVRAARRSKLVHCAIDAK